MMPTVLNMVQTISRILWQALTKVQFDLPEAEWDKEVPHSHRLSKLLRLFKLWRLLYYNYSQEQRATGTRILDYNWIELDYGLRV